MPDLPNLLCYTATCCYSAFLKVSKDFRWKKGEFQILCRTMVDRNKGRKLVYLGIAIKRYSTLLSTSILSRILRLCALFMSNLSNESICQLYSKRLFKMYIHSLKSYLFIFSYIYLTICSYTITHMDNLISISYLC